MLASKSINLLTSTMSGRLVMVTGSGVKSTAHKICSASFLAPCGMTSPDSRFPPSMIKLDMVV